MRMRNKKKIEEESELPDMQEPEEKKEQTRLIWGYQEMYNVLIYITQQLSEINQTLKEINEQ